MAVAPQKMANKSMVSLILGSQHIQRNKQRQRPHQIKRSKTYSHKRKRRGHIYNDSRHCSTQPAPTPYSNYHENHSHYYEEDDQPIDPSKIHRISHAIKDSFYSMSEVDPLTHRSEKNKSWPLITSFYKPQHQENTKRDSSKYFRMKEIDHMDHDESIIVHGHEQEDKIIYYYDHEQEQQKIFYAQLHLNIDDVFKKKAFYDEDDGGGGNVEATVFDLVLNEYHTNRMHLPEIEHYFILLYYNIKKSSIQQLQSLWSKLYRLFSSKIKQNIPLPTVYINFKNGQLPININNVFSMLYHPEFGIDIKKLREVVREYYYQWHPKCITFEGTEEQKLEMEMNMEIEIEIDRFAGISLDEISMENVTDEHEEMFGYKTDGFWSMTDNINAFPSLTADWIISRSPTPEISQPIITYEETPKSHSDLTTDSNKSGLPPKAAVKYLYKVLSF